MVDEQAVLEVMVEAVAQAHWVEIAAVNAAIEALGGVENFELDSRVAEWVVATVEVAFPDVGALPKPADLGRDQIATLGALRRALVPVLISRAG